MGFAGGEPKFRIGFARFYHRWTPFWNFQTGVHAFLSPVNLILKFSEWGSRVLPPANLILKFSEWGPRGFTINEFHSAIFRIGFTHFYHPRTLPANPILKFSEWGSRVFSTPGSRVFVTREPGSENCRIGLAGGNPILKISEWGSWVLIFTTRETQNAPANSILKCWE